MRIASTLRSTLAAARRSLLDPVVCGDEGLLAEHRALRLVIELQVYLVDGAVVAPSCETDAVPRSLALVFGAGHRLGTEDCRIGRDAGCQAALLEQGEDPARPSNAVVRKIELGDSRIGKAELVLERVAVEQLQPDCPVDLGVDEREFVLSDGSQRPLPEIEDIIDDPSAQALLVGRIPDTFS